MLTKWRAFLEHPTTPTSSTLPLLEGWLIVTGGEQALAFFSSTPPGTQTPTAELAFFDGEGWSIEKKPPVLDDWRLVQFAQRIGDKWLIGVSDGRLVWRTATGWFSIDTKQVVKDDARPRAAATDGERTWVVGDQGLVLQLDGDVWTRGGDEGTDEDLIAAFVHRNQLYVTTAAGALLTYNSAWTTIETGEGVVLHTPVGDDVCSFTATGTARCLRTKTVIPFARDTELSPEGLGFCPRRDDLLATDATSGRVFRFTGAAWTDATPPNDGVRFHQVIARANDFVLIGTEDGANHVHLAVFDGSSWRELPWPFGVEPLREPVVAPDGSVWAIFTEGLMCYVDGGWHRAPVCMPAAAISQLDRLAVAADKTVFLTTEERVSTDEYTHAVWRCEDAKDCERLEVDGAPLAIRRRGIIDIRAVARDDAYLATSNGLWRFNGKGVTHWATSSGAGGISVLLRKNGTRLVRGAINDGWIGLDGLLVPLPAGATYTKASADGTLYAMNQYDTGAWRYDEGTGAWTALTGPWRRAELSFATLPSGDTLACDPTTCWHVASTGAHAREYRTVTQQRARSTGTRCIGGELVDVGPIVDGFMTVLAPTWNVFVVGEGWTAIPGTARVHPGGGRRHLSGGRRRL